MIIQRIWALLIGSVSTTIAILKFVSIVNIPAPDALIHISTGIIFLAGALVSKGKYVRKTNLWLGIFYIIFGGVEINWPHIIAGVVSILISLTIKQRH
jgi:hypothetical protein